MHTKKEEKILCVLWTVYRMCLTVIIMNAVV